MPCGNCRFFEPGATEPDEDGDLLGQCRRTAPRAITFSTGGQPHDYTAPVAYWPIVEAKEWCGEHEDGGDRSKLN